MKPNPNTILSQAKGDISREALTGEKTGLFSQQIVSGESVYDRLRADEKLQYLLVNTSNGLTVTSRSGTEVEELTPAGDYYAVTAITDQRVFFLIGKENEDIFRTLEAPDITAATLSSGLLTTKAIFGTNTERYEFPVKKRASSDPSDAVSFVMESLVGMTAPVTTESTDKARPGKTPAESGPDSRRSASDGGIPIEKSPADLGEQTQSNAPGAVFIADQEEVSEGSQWSLDRATTTIGQVNASQDDLTEAINQLRRAKKDLQDVVTKPGVDTETVETAIERIDLRLNPLETIRSARAKADRKLLLADKGLHISEETFENVLSTIENAIQTANELDRPHEELLEQRKQILKHLGRPPSQATDQDASPGSDTAGEGGGGEDTKVSVSTGGSETTPSSDPDDVSQANREAPKSGVETKSDESTPGSEASSDTTTSTTDSNASTSPPDESTSSSAENPSRADLIEDLHRIKEEIGKQPTPIYIGMHSEFSREVFAAEFGGYQESIEAAFGDEARPPESDSPNGSGEDGSAEPVLERETEESSDQEAEHGKPSEQTESPTREDLVKKIAELDAKTKGALSTAEFTANSPYSYSDIYDHFDSWSDAVDAARSDSRSADDLLEELHRLEAELGYIPRTTDVEHHSTFAPYDYQAEFGGFHDALDAAGLDLKQQVNHTIRQVVEERDGKPHLSDFEDASPYSSGVVYRFYDGWDEAISAASTESTESSRQSSGMPGESDQLTDPKSPISQNELSEQYELLRNLRFLCATVADLVTGSGEEQLTADPMQEWFEAVEAFWKGESTDAAGFGSQQSERNEFTMNDYREEFGNGDRITEFAFAEADQLPATMQALLSEHVSEDLAEFYLPVDQANGARLPVIVETESELERAVKMLHSLPTEPQAAPRVKPSEEDEGSEGEDTTGRDDSEKTSRVPSSQDQDLREVNVITESIAQMLVQEGYKSRSDLKAATMDELAAIDGIGKQIALRIKLDVGE